MTLPRPLSALLFIAALVAALWRAWPAPAPAFVPPPSKVGNTRPAEFHTDLLPVAAPSAHAATLAELPDGRIAAAWFAGSREGAGDVAIWFSTREQNGWSAPRAIFTRQQVAAATLAHVRKLGNPVLFSANGRLHLWLVSAGIGGWAGSALNHSTSTDGGVNWSPPTRLLTSPFFNLGTLARTPPLALADGGLGLPVYHELIAKRGEWLRLDSAGRIVAKTRLPADGAQLQPAVAAFDAQRALALLRDAGPGPGQVRAASTADAGQTWQAQAPLPIGNPNASLALLRLPSGRLLLAGNPGEGRHILELWLGNADGSNWQKVRAIEQGKTNEEYSYPVLLLAGDGRIHLAWTWQRRAIKHAVFSEAWLEVKP